MRDGGWVDDGGTDGALGRPCASKGRICGWGMDGAARGPYLGGWWMSDQAMTMNLYITAK